MTVNGIDESGPCGSRGSFRLDRPPFLEEYIDSCARHIAASAGEGGTLGIFLCGSLSLGEAGVSLDPPVPALVGDIDILAVMDGPDTLERMIPQRYELGRSCEALTEEMEFLGHVDVGMILTRDLEQLPPRPGVFDLKRYGRTIHGSGDLLDLIPDYGPDRIGGGEAVKLLENRMASLLGRFDEPKRGGTAFPYSFLYEIARVHTDIATALLSISGLYESGYRRRAELLEEAVREGRIKVPVPDDLVRLVSYWTEFKINPSRSYLERGPDPTFLGQLWDDAAGRVISCWSACESFVQGMDGRGADVERLLAGRGRETGIRTNLSTWRSFLSGRSARSRLACLIGAGIDLCRRDPSYMVRSAAVRLIDAYREDGRDAVLGGTHGFPGQGWVGWEEAAAGVSALWREMVYGRRDA